jgi:glycosyltransferase involved in cell wall biosynthesis
VADDESVVSVIIPTYNRAALLRRTLDSLTSQSVRAARFEVVVADDGSSDDTRSVVESYGRVLRIRYFYQPDEGFRAGAARNAGARLAAAPVLAFLDTGLLAGPDFIQAHAAAHSGSNAPRAVAGYAYGFNRVEPFPWLGDLLDGLTAQQAVDQLGADPRFRDRRDQILEPVNFDTGRLAAPWWIFWSLNISVRATDFHAVGGFDEGFRGWGLEDVELGYRLAARGAQVVVSRQAWAVDVPHDRNMKSESESVLRNARYFLERHPEPVPEMLCARYVWSPRMNFEEMCRELARWAAESRSRDVAAELAMALPRLPAGSGDPEPRIAVFGCGAGVPPSWPPCTLTDFDRELLHQAAAAGNHTTLHGIGLVTPFPDRFFDEVIITSRLEGLWGRWGDVLLAEAARIGRAVHVPFLDEATLRGEAKGNSPLGPVE